MKRTIVTFLVLALPVIYLQAQQSNCTESVVRSVPTGSSGGRDNPGCDFASCQDVTVDSLPLNANITSIDHYAAEAGSGEWKLCYPAENSTWFDCRDSGWSRFRPADDINTVGGRKVITSHFRNWSGNHLRDAKILVCWAQ
jgi:hypothetical protein